MRYLSRYGLGAKTNFVRPSFPKWFFDLCTTSKSLHAPSVKVKLHLLLSKVHECVDNRLLGMRVCAASTFVLSYAGGPCAELTQMPGTATGGRPGRIGRGAAGAGERRVPLYLAARVPRECCYLAAIHTTTQNPP